MAEDPAAVAFAYHQRTRHAPQAFARALGWMDWDTQPDPFRRYTGSPVVLLERDLPRATATYDAVLDGDLPPQAPLDAVAVSRLFLDSLALSAWKEAGDARWSLRVNPSSGNLHPTESYLVCGPIAEIGDTPAVYHYNPYLHGLERRATLSAETWQRIAGDLPTGAILVGLTSIVWRESWKYGERAFRYCQHDLGHAIACVALAAAGLGRRVRLLESVPDTALAALLGIGGQVGIEAELPECLLVVYAGDFPLAQWRHFRLTTLPALEWNGTPAPLSSDHHDWPILDVVAEATGKRGPALQWQVSPERASTTFRRPSLLGTLARQRRSAVAMDGRTTLSRDAFFRTMHRALPGLVPFDAFPWQPAVDLYVFVHRVLGLEPGLYVLQRTSQAPGGVEVAPFVFRIKTGDFRAVAQGVSCGQEIAADGAFALGMIADLGALELLGAPFYRRLHWEAGAIGQVLYLEAESDGVQATGIGCFFDDEMHDAVGIPRGSSWKTIYHFTVGGPVEDDRLRTLAPYGHLDP